MSIPSNSVFNSGPKESTTQKFTKPLRGLLGGKIGNADGTSKEIFSRTEKFGVGILLTLVLPYTLVAGGILAGEALKNRVSKNKKPKVTVVHFSAVVKDPRESTREEKSHITSKSNISEEPIKPKKSEASSESQSSEELSSEHSSSSEDFNPLKFFNSHLLKTPEEREEQAKKIIEMANQGDARAQYMAGIARDYPQLDKYLTLNASDSLDYLNNAADQGYASAQLQLGLYYLAGKYVPQNSNRALQYFTSCIKDSNDPAYPEGNYQIGKCFQDGDATAKNDAFAHKYFQNAAEKGHAEAQYKTAKYYKTTDGYTKKKDLTEAFKYFQLASDQDHLEAKIELAYCYRFGKGTRKDVNRAFKIYQELAPESSAVKAELAQCYLEGIGTVKNDVEALRLFSEAADEGITQANYSIADLYLKKQGTLGNNDDPLHKAIQFFKTNVDNADALDNATAKNKLFEIYNQGIAGIINQDQDLAKTYL